MAAPDFPKRHLADKFLYRGLVRLNAYRCAKFQVPSSISYRDMKFIDYNVAMTFILIIIIIIIIIIWRGSQNTKWALLISPDAP